MASWQDSFYATVDAVSSVVNTARDAFASTVDPTMATFQPSEHRMRKIAEGTEAKIASRRALNRSVLSGRRWHGPDPAVFCGGIIC